MGVVWLRGPGQQKMTSPARKLVNVAVFIASLLASNVHSVGASCNEEQISSCRSAVVDEQLDTTSGGGDCVRKQYSDFTHVCVVKNYLPNVGHCCCQSERKVFCCRYHTTWENFRCMESDDVIPVSSENADFKEVIYTKVLPGTLVPAVCLVIVCSGCVVFYHISRRRKAQTQKGSLCCYTGSLSPSVSDVRSRYPDSRVEGGSTVPLASDVSHRHSFLTRTTNGLHLNTHLVPTAPPFDCSCSESAVIMCNRNFEVSGYPPNTYARLPSDLSGSVPSTASCHHCQCCPLVTGVVPSQSPAGVWNSIQPPSYEESQFHPRLDGHRMVTESLQSSDALSNNESSDTSELLQNSISNAGPALPTVEDSNMSTEELIPDVVSSPSVHRTLATSHRVSDLCDGREH